MPRTQRRVGLLDDRARCAPVSARGRGVGKDQPRAPQVSRSHVELLCFGLATETNAIGLYREAKQLCERIGAEGNCERFARILEDEVSHYHKLERALQALDERSAA